MGWTLGTLAEQIAGEVQGDATQEISGVAAIEAARPGELTFLADRSQLGRLADCQASAIVVPSQLAGDEKLQAFSRIVSREPQADFMKIALVMRPLRPLPARGISPQAIISPTAVIGPDCWIGPGAIIGDDVFIGANCDIHPGVVIGPGCRLGSANTLYPHAVLYHDTIIDDRVIIHANAVIGADGFGYKFTQGAFEKIPQLGWVHIHSDAEIGAGTTIDRGMIGATVIGQGTKIDNMVQIAHNCQIGKHNVFASQVGLAGSCITGDYVRLGGQVGVKDHVTMHTGSAIGAKGGVHKDIPAGETWIGYPATPEAEQKRLVFSLKRVPEMRETVRAMEAKIAALSQQLAELQADKPSPLQIKAA
ncbi:UDP-3-O-(3-hydroxymyristoyl)glucosamine N-acyltransferase [bacterium]|nr:UDP-3-O-(3-hydroxymyristoyl)glucosamine N-acyltransferase [bacterium]